MKYLYLQTWVLNSASSDKKHIFEPFSGERQKINTGPTAKEEIYKTYHFVNLTTETETNLAHTTLTNNS